MNIRNMFLLIAVLFTLFTVNCWGGICSPTTVDAEPQFEGGNQTGDKLCTLCGEDEYVATYTNNDITYQLNPKTVFHSLYETYGVLCWDVYEVKNNYENLRKLTNGDPKQVSPCYQNGTPYTCIPTNCKMVDYITGIKAKIVDAIKANSDSKDGIITCEPCPNGGHTKGKTRYLFRYIDGGTSYVFQWTAFNTIADCYTDTFTDETGTFRNKVQLSNSSYYYQECNYAE